jgi:dihydropteroate synthase
VERDAGTVACITAGMMHGAQIYRVHHVSAAAQAVKVLWGVLPPGGVSSMTH